MSLKNYTSGLIEIYFIFYQQLILLDKAEKGRISFSAKPIFAIN